METNKFPGIVLQERDKKLIDFLRIQGAATFDQLLVFFPNIKVASRRLIKLEQSGVIKSNLTAKAFGFDEHKFKFFPVLLDLKLKPKTKIFKLSDLYLAYFSKSAKLATKEMTLHQLLLNEVRFFLENIFREHLFLNDVDVHFMSKSFNNKEPLVPDLTITTEKYKIAIELERTLKSKSRYGIRMARFSASSFTHVLFFYAKEDYLETLISCSRPYRNIGFVDVMKMDFVYSNGFGKLKLQDWITKVDELNSSSTSDSKFKMFQLR